MRCPLQRTAAQAHSAAVRRYHVTTSRVQQRAGGLTFFYAAAAGRRQLQAVSSCVRTQRRDRVLIDPTQAGGAGHVSLDWWRASPDGRYVVYGVRRRNGSEDFVLHVLTVADGRVLPLKASAVPRAANPHWLDDGSGFFYNQLTGASGHPRTLSRQPGAFPPLGDRSGRRSSDHEARSHRRGRVRENTGALCRHLPGFQIRGPHAE